MPFRSDAGMLYYRQDLLESAGYQPPETFEELVSISEDLQNRGLAKLGYLWQGKQYEGLAAMFVEILEGYGAFWVNPETLEVGLDRPEAIQAVEFLRSTLEKKDFSCWGYYLCRRRDPPSVSKRSSSIFAQLALCFWFSIKF